MDFLSRLEAPANALAILTAMITPAVLISACAALVFSTITRLGRTVDRVRYLSNRFEEMAREGMEDELRAERRVVMFGQLKRQSARAMLIQRALMAFYTALGIFVATSIAIALVAAVARNYTWVAVGLGILGAVVMFYGSILLIIETRMALGGITSELEFVEKVSRKYGEDLHRTPQAVRGGFTWLGRRFG